MGCLDDNTAVDFATGGLQGQPLAQVEAHLATCRDCRTLVAALAPEPGEPDSDVITSPHPVALGKRGHNLAAALSPTEPRGSEPRRPAEPVVAPGDTIGRYIVLRRIGAGGMGVVFSAYDPQLDRKVALKLLRTGTGVGEREARARLVREAQAIAQLSHPNVVAVYDVGAAAEGDVYVAMEFVEGDTLTQWLARWHRPWREVLEVFREAGRGLAAAHRVGLLHRDFKPDNVLVGADGRVRVTDFGLARSLMTAASDELDQIPTDLLTALRVTLTATGAIMGTPRYMAPEQLRGEDVGAAADQFSFCVALYEALYGVHPIAGDTAARMIEEDARAQPPPPDSQVPAWVAPLILRGLEPHPARRHPSVGALVQELSPPAPSGRRRVYLALAGAAALVLSGAAAAKVVLPAPERAASEVDPAEIESMRQQLEEIAEERDRLIAKQAELNRRLQEADNNRVELSREVVKLAGEVTAKEEQIEKLQVKLVALGERAAVPPRPVRRDDGGLSLATLRQTIDPQHRRLSGCFTEWADRTGGSAGRVELELKIAPSGLVWRAAMSGLDNDHGIRECINMAIAQTRFPRSERVTVATLQLTLFEGEVRVDVRRLGSEDAPPLIDNPGE